MSFTKIGDEAAAFICAYVNSHPEIASIKLFRVPRTPALQSRSLVPQDEQIVHKALEIKKNLDLPFWDAVTHVLCQGHHATDGLIKRLTMHNASNSGVQSIHRGALNRSHIDQILHTLSDDYLLVISSRVLLSNGSEAFIPMMDFHINNY
ncbi:hypothetical protein EON65_57090, partial [archaeon]